jgi:hypothetical protein
VAENHKKTIVTVKQQFKLLQKFQNRGWVTELAKDCGVGIE